MARAAQARYLRSVTKTGNLSQLQTVLGGTQTVTTTAPYATGGTATTYRFNAATAGTAVAVPTAGTAPSGTGWRDAVAENAAEQVTYAAGNWGCQLVVDKTGQTVAANITVTLTAIFYRVTSAGVFVSEIGRAVQSNLTIATTAVTVNPQFSVGALTFNAGDRVQVEVYVTHLTAGSPAAPAAAVTVRLLLDQPSAAAATSVTPVPAYDVNYQRALPETVAGVDTVARRFTAFRANPETLTTSDNPPPRKFPTKVRSESLTTVDAAARRATNLRSLPETVTALHTVVAGFTGGRVLMESLSTVDTVARRHTAFRSLALETVTGADTLTRKLSGVRTLPETVTGTDTVARRFAALRALPETVTGADTVKRDIIYGRTVSENIGATGGGQVVEVAKPLALVLVDGDPALSLGGSLYTRA